MQKNLQRKLGRQCTKTAACSRKGMRAACFMSKNTFNRRNGLSQNVSQIKRNHRAAEGGKSTLVGCKDEYGEKQAIEIIWFSFLRYA